MKKKRQARSAAAEEEEERKSCPSFCRFCSLFLNRTQHERALIHLSKLV